jgi:hypothetical protein
MPAPVADQGARRCGCAADGFCAVDQWPAGVLIEQATAIHAGLVADLRSGGVPASWAQIGDELGTSRQAAQQRFGGKGHAAQVGSRGTGDGPPVVVDQALPPPDQVGRAAVRVAGMAV